MINKPRVLVSVSGQLRNCTDVIENWKKTVFSNCDCYFVFDIWDDIGNVDLNKAYCRSLDVKKIGPFSLTKISKNNIYLKPLRTLDVEIDNIKRVLSNVEINVHKYNKQYLNKIGKLEINDKLIEDTHPWWQGSIPVAYINKLASDNINKNHSDYDFYCRVQSESFFLECSKWYEGIDENTIVTSPDTIDKKYQVSMKFFSGNLKNFTTLMNAYDNLIYEYDNYQSGTTFTKQPIGERYLYQLSKKNKLNLKFDVRMKLNREKIIPIDPVWKLSYLVKKNWTLPKIINISSDDYRLL